MPRKRWIIFPPSSPPHSAQHRRLISHHASVKHHASATLLACKPAFCAHRFAFPRVLLFSGPDGHSLDPSLAALFPFRTSRSRTPSNCRNAAFFHPRLTSSNDRTGYEIHLHASSQEREWNFLLRLRHTGWLRHVDLVIESRNVVEYLTRYQCFLI